MFFFSAVGLDGFCEVAHGVEHVLAFFVGGEELEAFFGGHFDIDAEAVCIFAGLVEEFRACAGDGFEVDIAIEVLFGAEFFGDEDESFHGVVGVSEDAAAEEESFDVIAPVEIDGEVDDFLDGEGSAFGVVAFAADAVGAIEDAVVGEEDLEEGDAAAVFGIGMTDAHTGGITETFGVVGAFAAAGGAGDIVFGGVGENGEFFFDSIPHSANICSI